MAKPLTCFLVTMQTGTEVTRKVVDANPFTIGRSLEAAISIIDTNVSRAHVLVKNKGGRVWIEDQGSINGTFLNGVKLEPKRLTPLETDDVIKLGKTNVSMKIVAIERIFAPEFVSTSTDLQTGQKDSLLNLIQGAHNEAQRLVKMGRDLHDAAIQQAEARAAGIENSMANQRNQILAQAQERANQLILEAEGKAKKEVLSIHLRATEVRQKADEYRRQLIEKAQDEVEKIYGQQRERCQEMIDEANERIIKLNEIADAEAVTTKRKATTESGMILEEARIQAEHDAQEYFDSVRDETVRRMEVYENEEREKIEEERVRMIKETEGQMSSLRIERKRLETEMNSEIRRLQSDIDSSNIELKELHVLIEKQKNVAADEIAYKRELFEKEMKSEQGSAKRALETSTEQKRQEIEKFKLIREEETRTAIKEQTLAFDKIKRKNEKDIEELEDELLRLTPLVKKATADFTSLQAQEQMAKSNYDELLFKFQKLNDALKNEANTKTELLANIRLLEKDVGRLAMDKQNLEGSIANLQMDMQQRIAAHKSILDEEFARLRRVQQEELDSLRLSEMDRLKKDRQNAVEDFAREKESIANDILSAVFEELTKPSALGAQDAINATLKKKINTTLEERSLSLLTDHHGEHVTVNKIQGKRNRERRASGAQGMLLGMLLLIGFQYGQERFLADSNPMKTAAEEKARAREEDLERRKFSPPQDEELRSSYKDCVIYTKDFVEVYTSTEFQEKFLKAATIYLLKQWRIEEDKSVEALSAVTTLVKVLDEKKKAIHPDFVKEGLKKMEDAETEAIAHVNETLGTEVRYEAFRKFEKKFYLNFRQERLPAGGD